MKYVLIIIFYQKASLGKLKKDIENLDIEKLNIIPFELKKLIYVVDKEVFKSWESNTNKKQITKLKKLEKKYEILPDQLLILTLIQKLYKLKIKYQVL